MTRFNPDRETLTTGQIASICGVSAQTVINWIARGKLRSARIDRGPRRVPAEDVADYLAKNNYPMPEWLQKFLPAHA